jgi:transcription antitermination factor NusG
VGFGAAAVQVNYRYTTSIPRLLCRLYLYGFSNRGPKFFFETGDEIRVIDGPFTNFNGTVEDVNPEKGKIKVLVSIFGRSTPVELDFVQVTRL